VARQSRPLVPIMIFELGTAFRLPGAPPHRIIAAAMLNPHKFVGIGHPRHSITAAIDSSTHAALNNARVQA
jgi:hypothetical protein